MKQSNIIKQHAFLLKVQKHFNSLELEKERKTYLICFVFLDDPLTYFNY